MTATYHIRLLTATAAPSAKLQLVKLFCDNSQNGLRQAKDLVDALLRSEEILLEFQGADPADFEQQLTAFQLDFRQS